MMKLNVFAKGLAHAARVRQQVGAHYKDACDPTKGGVTRYIGDKDYINDTRYYNTRLEMFNEYLQQWVKKKKNSGFTTFFPDEWTKQKVQQEMALAFKNKKYLYTRNGIDTYLGIMSDGVDCIVYIEKNIITSMYPSFN